MRKGLIDDNYLIYLIDSELYTFKQLEQELEAGKNQLRDRYNRAKHTLEKDSKRKQDGERYTMPIIKPIIQDPFIPENYTSSPEIIKKCLRV